MNKTYFIRYIVLQKENSRASKVFTKYVLLDAVNAREALASLEESVRLSERHRALDVLLISEV